MSLQLHQTPMLGYRPVPKKLPDGSQTDHSDPNGVPDHSLTAFSWMYGPLPFRFGTPLWGGVCHGHGLRLVDKFYPAAAELLTTDGGWPRAAKSCVQNSAKSVGCHSGRRKESWRSKLTFLRVRRPCSIITVTKGNEASRAHQPLRAQYPQHLHSPPSVPIQTKRCPP